MYVFKICRSLEISGLSWLTGILTHTEPYLPSLIWLIGAAGFTGMTTAVALLSDALGLLTAHLYVCYVISATVFSHQLSLAGSLWNLFRGQSRLVSSML